MISEDELPTNTKPSSNEDILEPVTTNNSPTLGEVTPEVTSNTPPFVLNN